MFLQQNVMKDPATASQMEVFLKQIAPVRTLVGKHFFGTVFQVFDAVMRCLEFWNMLCTHIRVCELCG